MPECHYIMVRKKHDTAVNMLEEELNCEIQFLDDGVFCKTTILVEHYSFLTGLHFFTLVELGIVLYLPMEVLITYVDSYTSKYNCTSGKSDGKFMPKHLFPCNTSYHIFLFESPEGKLSAAVTFLICDSSSCKLEVSSDVKGVDRMILFLEAAGKQILLGPEIWFIYSTFTIMLLVALHYRLRYILPFLLILHKIPLVYILVTIIDTVINRIKVLESRLATSVTNQQRTKKGTTMK
eukprot:snap_masked-scaffold_2-processed-gene-0.41-mRNA-1 protein AED:1.00 eAED:1.00 QI:0/0/0/0/1/1/3/0/235